MGLIVTLAAVTILVVALLLWPLLRARRHELADPAAHDMAVYAAQLGDLERDQLDGKIDAETAVEARREIERRILALDRRAARAQSKGRMPKLVVAAGILVVVPSLAGGLYWRLGSPMLPDQPLASRPAPEDNLGPVLAELAARVADAPDDANNQLRYGQALFAASQYTAAADAFAKAVELTDSRPDTLGLYGEALVYASGGFVTAEARAIFARIQELPRARYYEGVALYQSGDRQEALDAWLALAGDAPVGAPWLATVEQRIEVVAQELGQDPVALLEDLPERAAPPVNPEQIRAMVEGLQARLATDTPDDLEGWLMLARSLQVLGELPQAADAWQRAVTLSPDDPDILVGYGVALMRAGDESAPMSLEVRATMENALRLDADNPDALWFAGIGAMQNGDNAVARQRWERLLELLPPDSEQYAIVRQQLDALTEAR